MVSAGAAHWCRCVSHVVTCVSACSSTVTWGDEGKEKAADTSSMAHLETWSQRWLCVWSSSVSSDGGSVAVW